MRPRARTQPESLRPPAAKPAARASGQLPKAGDPAREAQEARDEAQQYEQAAAEAQHEAPQYEQAAAEAQQEAQAAPYEQAAPQLEPEPAPEPEPELELDADDPHIERLSASFFAQPHGPEPVEPWEHHPPEPLSAGARRAMMATAAIIAVFTLGIVGFVVYHRLVMPVPVELAEGAKLPPAIPQPIAPPPPPVGSVLSRVAEQRASSGPTLATPAETASEDVAAGEPETVSAEAAAGADEPGQEASQSTSQEAGQEPAAVIVDPVETEAAPEAAAPAAAEVSPSNAVPSDSGFASMMNTANTLYRRGQHAGALEAYHRALSFWPDAPQALSRIAYVHLNLGENKQAQQYGARAVEIDPTNSEGWIVLGAALEALRDRPAAIAAYRKCATLASGQYVTECRRLSR